jgi:hypothetical protein
MKSSDLLPQIQAFHIMVKIHHHHHENQCRNKINNLPLVGNPPTNNLRESNSVGGVRFHRFSSGDGTALVAAILLGAEGGGASINGPPTTATGTLAAIAVGAAAVGAGCCSRAEEIVRGLQGARGGGVGPFTEPPARTRGSSTMPCCGLDVMLDGGASMLSAAAAVMSNNFISAEDKIIGVIMRAATAPLSTATVKCKGSRLLFLGGVAWCWEWNSHGGTLLAF